MDPAAVLLEAALSAGHVTTVTDVDIYMLTEEKTASRTSIKPYISKHRDPHCLHLNLDHLH